MSDGVGQILAEALGEAWFGVEEVDLGRGPALEEVDDTARARREVGAGFLRGIIRWGGTCVEGGEGDGPEGRARDEGAALEWGEGEFGGEVHGRVSVSSRLSTRLATAASAASSGGGRAVIRRASPTPSIFVAESGCRLK